MRKLTVALLSALCLSGSAIAQPGASAEASAYLIRANYMESTIDGQFEGWSGETVLVLSNGQIWQQSEYTYEYHYAYRPRVIIMESGGGFAALVDGTSRPVRVRRLR